MERCDDVIPDSEEEIELEEIGTTYPQEELFINDVTTSLHASSSFVLPPPMPAGPPDPRLTAPSSISQFTATMETVPALTEPSAISAYTSSSSASRPQPRPRPRPRPAYAAAKPAPAPPTNMSSVASTSPPALLDLQPPPPTFSMSISERIKGRRRTTAPSSPVSPVNTQENSSKRLEKRTKETFMAAEIDIYSDGSSPRPPHSQKRPSKKSQSINASQHVAQTPPSPQQPNFFPTQQSFEMAADTSDSFNIPQSSIDSVPKARQTKRRKKTRNDKNDKNEESTLENKAGEKKGKGRKTTKGPVQPEPESQAREQFKSREFIEDSDDELALGISGPTADDRSLAKPSVTVSQLVQDAGYSLDDQMEMRGKLDVDAVSEKPVHDQSQKLKKRKKKRGATGVEGTQPPRKRKRMDGKTAIQSSEIIVNDAGIDSKDEDTQLLSKRKGGRKVIEDDDDQSDTGKGNILPVSPSSILTTENASPPSKRTSPPTTNKDEVERNISKDNEDQDYLRSNKENAPLSKSLAAKTHVSPNKCIDTATPEAKPHIQPPKNRPLPLILQQLNGSTTRFRLSPSVSRTLLTRIAPLHPNRRPPPPPPPRIVPKKTKKEIEREEKWEEELQESVPGWCELEEGERERMRRAKKDWELGLCED